MNWRSDWLVLDLETAAGRPEDVESAFRLDWLPDPRWKDETIAKRYREAWAKRQERAALVPTAPIFCIACKTPLELCVFHSGRFESERKIGEAVIRGFETQADMLKAYADFLWTRADGETVLAGHNVQSFDLPRLRTAFLKAGLVLPRALVGDEQPVCDTMKVFARRFLGDTSLMPSLHEACGMVGLSSHKPLVNGADIPGLIAAGRVDEVVTYCALDATLEAELFLKLTGQK